MTYLIVVLMYAVNPAAGEPFYIFTQPSFTSFQDCNKYLHSYNQFIYRNAGEAYKYKLTPKEIYCVDKELIPELLKPQGTSI